MYMIIHGDTVTPLSVNGLSLYFSALQTELFSAIFWPFRPKCLILQPTPGERDALPATVAGAHVCAPMQN